ncbi:MAG: class I SAM-dependent methyltransferase [Planctomycetaceae bacterium]|nr:class I SAM-dependent methyltransferase [Planctomycetaceae bacterium]MCA9022862.1 class I SAM-dependent methyltransferase [Planctomycetaceae bacterium]
MTDAEDRWDGSEYADNSSMQYRQALEALERIDIGLYGRVLDIGCGNGAVTKYISEQMPPGQVIGIDVSPSMVEFAHQQYAEPGRIDFQQMSADQLEFNDAFDLVCSFSILHWVKRQWDVWSGIHRALRDGGRVLAGFQADHEEFWDAVSIVAQRSRWKPLLTDFDDPYNHWTREFMLRCIRGNGFYIERFDEIIGDEYFGTREALADFFCSWVPAARHVPAEVRQDLMNEILDLYFQRVDSELVNQAGVRMKRYIIQGWKR